MIQYHRLLTTHAPRSPDKMEVEGSSTAPSPSSHVPWVEKFRPTLVEEIVGNPEAVERLKIIALEGNMPNIIISVSISHSSR